MLDPATAIFVNRGDESSLREFAEGLQVTNREEFVGILCALHEPTGGYWRILDYTTQFAQFEALRNHNFIVMAWDAFMRKDDGKSTLRSECVVRGELVADIKEMRSELSWIEHSLDLCGALDAPRFQLPPTSRYQPIRLNSFPDFKRFCFSQRLRNIGGD